MASDSEFAKAVSYAVCKVWKMEIVLKPEQLQAVCHMYDGRDVSLWLPTGFGKSIRYEVLPFLFDFKLGKVDTESSGVIVVSPLVSLMVPQVTNLQSRRVRAAIYEWTQRCVDKELLAMDPKLQLILPHLCCYTFHWSCRSMWQWRWGKYKYRCIAENDTGAQLLYQFVCCTAAVLQCDNLYQPRFGCVESSQTSS